MGSTKCSPVDIPVFVWIVGIVIVCGSVVLVVGVVFYRYRMHQRDAQSETQLTEIHQMNQSLLESANNPLEQSQYNIPSHELDLHERIASGGNGWIYTATMGANTLVAAKEIMSTTIDPDDILEFEHEARMLTQLNHPHVLRVFGFCTKTAEESKDNQERRYIVTEFAPNGSLEDVIVAAARVAKVIKDSNSGAIPMSFTKMQALEWAVQIASGIAFLHSKGFVHRDIKPQNVLLNKSNDALVADLGTVRRPPSGLYPHDKVPKSTTTDQEKEQYMEEFCQDMDEEQGRVFTLQATLRGMTDMKGTPMYMAPEQFQDPSYSYPVDVWAYGLTLMRLFTFKWPFPLETPLKQLVMGIARNELRPELAEEGDVPHQDVLKLMEECVQFEAGKRPTMKEVERRLTNVLKMLLDEEKELVKKERRRIKDIKKERRIKRRETERLAKEKESTVHRERKKG
jgi:serine/threonine protein kinase